MNTIKLNGKIHSIGKVQVVSEKFKKREVILQTKEDDRFPEYRLIQFANDKADLLNNVQPGMEVSINVNVKGRLWTGNDGIVKCFNTDDGWSIENLGQQQPKQIQSTSNKMRHPSGFNGEMAQDDFDRHMFPSNDDLF